MCIYRGCKSIAVLDLNGTEAKDAAQKLEAYSKIFFHA